MITIIVAAAAFAAGVYFSESVKALVSKVM